MRQLDAVAAATKQLDKNEQWRPRQEPKRKPTYRITDRLSSDTLDNIVARYEAGEPTTAIAVAYRLSY